MTKQQRDPSERQERDRDVAAIRERPARIESEKSELEARLARLLATQEVNNSLSAVSGAPVTNASNPAAKITLFRPLFRGREDVFPKRWENANIGKTGYAPACANEWVPRICGKPKVKCGDCPNRTFLSVTDEVIDGHLRGRYTIGVYPMLADETCWFLAADFDKTTWCDDAAAFLETCDARGVPAALERSRSGQGGQRMKGDCRPSDSVRQFLGDENCVAPRTGKAGAVSSRKQTPPRRNGSVIQMRGGLGAIDREFFSARCRIREGWCVCPLKRGVGAVLP